MSLQVFLQAQLLGSEHFLSSTDQNHDGYLELLGAVRVAEPDFGSIAQSAAGEMKLSRMLLGSSGGEQFLLVLTDDSIPEANTFLQQAADAISAISGGTLRLVWASTENLGAWPIVGKRLEEGLERKKAAPLHRQGEGADVFAPFERPEVSSRVRILCGVW